MYPGNCPRCGGELNTVEEPVNVDRHPLTWRNCIYKWCQSCYQNYAWFQDGIDNPDYPVLVFIGKNLTDIRSEI